MTTASAPNMAEMAGERFLLRLPAELRARIEALAKREHRNLTGEILHLLEVASRQEERRLDDEAHK